MDDILPGSCEQDTMFEVLADPRRRRLITLLREHESVGRVFLDSLSAQLAEREAELDTSVEEIAVELHHRHLPRLDAAGLVRYEPSAKMVELTRFSVGSDGSLENFDTALGDD
ncbi:DUF7344 domain-containing protein [Halomicrobium urmianum]|uniref:DUF7344 domain-containing protein n=1 Tax=Halomicrobium urmianum TaxID=1586233 RepID=UPI001CD920C1|nr:hypothetical protein [Halomicrobium urmianum]